MRPTLCYGQTAKGDLCVGGRFNPSSLTRSPEEHVHTGCSIIRSLRLRTELISPRRVLVGFSYLHLPFANIWLYLCAGPDG